jgi:NAD(P)H dehydrogenase (quinone)
MASDLIAVTGATGALGGRVARILAEAGARQRLVVRDPARAPELPGASTAVASYGDRAALRDAFDGAGTLLLVSATECADRVALHTATIDAALEAGVDRIVYISFLGAGPACTFTFGRDHWHTEQHIRGAGVDFTFLRDSLYLDHIPFFVRSDGVIRGPAGDGRVAAVARNDIADAASAVLLGDAHSGRTYELTGPRAFTLADAADELSRATGRRITYHAETLDEAYASRSGYGAPRWEVDGWVTSYSAVAAGELDVVTDHVEQLTGHIPMGLADYLAANPATPSGAA